MYIEINFIQDVDDNEDGFEALKELPDYKLDPHPKSMEEINAAIKVLFPNKELEIDWRDTKTVWIWPKGYGVSDDNLG